MYLEKPGPCNQKTFLYYYDFLHLHNSSLSFYVFRYIDKVISKLFYNFLLIIIFQHNLELSSSPQQTGTQRYTQDALYAISTLHYALYECCTLHFGGEKFAALPLENTDKKCIEFDSDSMFSRHVSDELLMNNFDQMAKCHWLENAFPPRDSLPVTSTQGETTSGNLKFT
jgi:hypothetical protein